eukprot:TRINITY_DN6022_c0_g1_i1.p1 TRINITY_DN6022_c0_g1~~TRINITY_DN6022_c0_g1_i1.p1  ORF type:complete len:705 (-),score=99.10 TRINITY_DN6022_c0_g1_i1:116-2230(-)
MASRKIADGPPAIGHTSGGSVAQGTVRKVRAVAAAVTAAGISPTHTQGRVGFLRKTYQQARATIVVAPASVEGLAQEHQGDNDYEDEESKEQSEIQAMASETSPPKKSVSGRWLKAQSMVTGASKALAYHNDMVQKIRQAAQAAFERHRLLNDMLATLSAAMAADVESAAPGISDCIEDILYDITDAKVKDQASVAEKVLSLISTPEQTAALQNLRDCLIGQLEGDHSARDHFEQVYEKLRSRVTSMREKFGVLQRLQEVPAPEQASLSKHYFQSHLEQSQTNEALTNNSGQSPGPKPAFGPKPDEVKPALGSRPVTGERLQPTQPNLQPSAQPTLVREDPTPCPAPVDLRRQASVQQEALSCVLSVARQGGTDEDEWMARNTSGHSDLEFTGRLGNNYPHEVPNDNRKCHATSSRSAHILMKTTSFEAGEAVYSSTTSESSGNVVEQSQRGPRAKAEPSEREPLRSQAAPPVELNNPGFGALDLPPLEDCKDEASFRQAEPREREPLRSQAAPPVELDNPGFGALDLPPLEDCKDEASFRQAEPREREPLRSQAAPPVELDNPGFGALDLPPLENCKGEASFRQDDLFEMIVVGRSPRSKPTTSRQLRLRFPLLPMFPRTPREDRLPSPRFDPCRSVAKAAAEVFPGIRPHAAAPQSFLPVLPKTPDAGQLMTQSGKSRLGSPPSFCIGNSDRAHTWNNRNLT